MATEEKIRGPASGATKLRLRWLGVVVAVMALLTAGWPLLNSAVHNQHPLAAGSRLTVGTSPSSAEFTVARGWSLLSAQSNPTQGYVLQRGSLQLSITHIALVNQGQGPELWQGLRQILSLSNPGMRLSRPQFITTRHGVHAMTGLLTSPRQLGTATIFPGPSGNFGIAMVALGPRRISPALRAAAHRMTFSLMFPARGR